MRLFLVDTITMVVFFTTIATFSELVVAGMDPSQVAAARAIMIPVMIVTGRPYGIWRGAVFARLRPMGWLAETATDIAAFLSFQVPVYVATLIVAGASRTEILAAVTSATVGMVIASRPYGFLLDKVRQWAGVTPA